jgi:hypothetical protein
MYVFGKLKLYKIFEECILKAVGRHIFRIPLSYDMGMIGWKQDYASDDFEYIYRRHAEGLEPVNREEMCYNNLFTELGKDPKNLAWLRMEEIKKEK